MSFDYEDTFFVRDAQEENKMPSKNLQIYSKAVLLLL